MAYAQGKRKSFVSLKAAADTFQDDASALDLPTLRRWNILLRVFMSEYLNLRPSDLATRSDPSSPVQKSDSELVSLNSSSKPPKNGLLNPCFMPVVMIVVRPYLYLRIEFKQWNLIVSILSLISSRENCDRVSRV